MYEFFLPCNIHTHTHTHALNQKNDCLYQEDYRISYHINNNMAATTLLEKLHVYREKADMIHGNEFRPLLSDFDASLGESSARLMKDLQGKTVSYISRSLDTSDIERCLSVMGRHTQTELSEHYHRILEVRSQFGYCDLTHVANLIKYRNAVAYLVFFFRSTKDNPHWLKQLVLDAKAGDESARLLFALPVINVSYVDFAEQILPDWDSEEVRSIVNETRISDGTDLWPAGNNSGRMTRHEVRTLLGNDNVYHFFTTCLRKYMAIPNDGS